MGALGRSSAVPPNMGISLIGSLFFRLSRLFKDSAQLENASVA